MDAFGEFCRELGPVDVPGRVAVVQCADLVWFGVHYQLLIITRGLKYTDLVRPFLVSLPLHDK